MIFPSKGEGNQNAKSIITIEMMPPHPREMQHVMQNIRIGDKIAS